MDGEGKSGAAERYERTTAFVWTQRAFDLLEAGTLRAEIRQPRPGVRTSHVWGPCPRCGHDIDDWQPLSAVTGVVRRTGSEIGSAPAAAEVIDIGCGCGTTHADAPGGVTGCGVSFRVELEPVPPSDMPSRDSR